MKTRYDFTLVEMLVVVGIIAVLAGLVMPAVGHARATARRTACLSNQSETMKIVTQSMNDNRQFLVSGDDFSDSPGDDAGWTRYLYGEGNATNNDAMSGKKSYLQNLTAFRCPAFLYEEKQDLGALNAANRQAALEQAYGMMYKASPDAGFTFAGFDFRGTKYQKYSNGSDKYNISPGSLVLGGCVTANSAPYDTAKSLWYDGSGTWANKIAKVHSDFANAFFLDGHAESINEDGLTTKYFPADDEVEKFTDTAWLDPDDD